jgi:hypothetical protein
MRAAQRSFCVCPIFLRDDSDGIHELTRQGCDAAEALKKIQRHAFGFENRARKAAHLDDNVASDYGSAIRLMDLDVRRRIDPAENFRSRRGAGNNGWFPSNDASGCVQPLGNEKLGGDVPVADIFFKRGRDWIVVLRVHGGAKPGRYLRNASASIKHPTLRLLLRAEFGQKNDSGSAR